MKWWNLHKPSFCWATLWNDPTETDVCFEALNLLWGKGRNHARCETVSGSKRSVHYGWCHIVSEEALRNLNANCLFCCPSLYIGSRNANPMFESQVECTSIASASLTFPQKLSWNPQKWRFAHVSKRNVFSFKVICRCPWLNCFPFLAASRWGISSSWLLARPILERITRMVKFKGPKIKGNKKHHMFFLRFWKSF